MEHWRSVLPIQIHEVVYEELVANPEDNICLMLSYCGLDFERGCVEFHRTRRIVQSASHWQVRQPLYTRSAGRWKHYESFLPQSLLSLCREKNQ